MYQNQVFVTDNVEGIVPEFLTMLRGVIDSPDIPLNVSRSYLQSDGAVKKISNYITKKVADKLQSIFNKDRKNLEEKWDDIKVVIEYGMLSEEKFFDKAVKFNLFPTTDNKYLIFDELKEKTIKSQTDKDNKLVQLYASNVEEQHSYIEIAKSKNIKVYERKINPSELSNFVGCFLTGTAAEVTPVSCIAENQFKVCETIINLNESYQALVRKKKAA